MGSTGGGGIAGSGFEATAAAAYGDGLEIAFAAADVGDVASTIWRSRSSRFDSASNFWFNLYITNRATITTTDPNNITQNHHWLVTPLSANVAPLFAASPPFDPPDPVSVSLSVSVSTTTSNS